MAERNIKRNKQKTIMYSKKLRKIDRKIRTYNATNKLKE